MASLIPKLWRPLMPFVLQSSKGSQQLKALVAPASRRVYSTESTVPAITTENADSDMPLTDMTNPYEKDKRQCILCKYQVSVDYKNTRLLAQFVSPFTGKIYERNITGLCKEQQKRVENEIRKAQSFGFMPTMLKQAKYMKDPKICDPNKPVRPHRF